MEADRSSWGSSTSCDCCSIKISGLHVKAIDPNLLHGFPARAKAGKFVELSLKSIELRKPEKVEIFQYSENHYKMTCELCHRSFLIIVRSSKMAHCCKLPKKRKAIPRLIKPIFMGMKHPIFELFSGNIAKFISEQRTLENSPVVFVERKANENEAASVDDSCDYDLMFSSRGECIVGSLTSEWICP